MSINVYAQRTRNPWAYAMEVIIGCVYVLIAPGRWGLRVPIGRAVVGAQCEIKKGNGDIAIERIGGLHETTPSYAICTIHDSSQYPESEKRKRKAKNQNPRRSLI